MFTCPATDDFFRSRIDQMIDLRHPLAVLSSRMPWQEIEARVAHLLVRKAHAGQAMPDLDPASRYILIHSGNHSGHTEGCLLVGTSKSENFVGGSRPKLNELLQFLGCYDLNNGNYSLEIKESF